MGPQTARRIVITGDLGDLSHRRDLVGRARHLGLTGWVRLTDDGRLLVHAEGDAPALGRLRSGLASAAAVAEFSEEPAKVEGHEQFAIRGIPAGVFVVQEHQATAHHFDLRLEVGGRMRSWAVPKGPSLDPAAKRLAVQVEDHDISHNDFEGPAAGGGVIVWDRGDYEQRGRVPWPEALERGHAVFVLHGAKLRGGFALQRTRGGAKPQWLLIKRRDDQARPGSDVVAERPESVISGRSLAAVLDGQTP